MTPPWIRWALILCLALNAAHLHAQDTEEDAAAPADARGRVKPVPAFGLRYGPPLGASVYGGVIVSREDPTGYAGPSLVGEVGQDGMRVSLGAASVSLAGTFRAQLSAIHTWDSHGDVQADQTYVGPEIAVGLVLGVTVGHYWRVSDGGGKARILAIGTFLGF
jgi:hypothetical protein